MTEAQKERSLSEIAASCHLRRSDLKLRNGAIHFLPDPAEKYERVDCGLRKLMELRGYDINGTGFIGNEAPAPKEKN